MRPVNLEEINTKASEWLQNYCQAMESHPAALTCKVLEVGPGVYQTHVKAFKHLFSPKVKSDGPDKVACRAIPAASHDYLFNRVIQGLVKDLQFHYVGIPDSIGKEPVQPDTTDQIVQALINNLPDEEMPLEFKSDAPVYPSHQTIANGYAPAVADPESMPPEVLEECEKALANNLTAEEMVTPECLDCGKITDWGLPLGPGPRCRECSAIAVLNGTTKPPDRDPRSDALRAIDSEILAMQDDLESQRSSVVIAKEHLTRELDRLKVLEDREAALQRAQRILQNNEDV